MRLPERNIGRYSSIPIYADDCDHISKLAKVNETDTKLNRDSTSAKISDKQVVYSNKRSSKTEPKES